MGEFWFEVVKWASGPLMAGVVSYFATVYGLRERLKVLETQVEFLREQVRELRVQIRDLELSR